MLQTMVEYKAEWDMELERRKLQAISSLPDPLPHPDDIIVDYRRNTASIRGPMDKHELADPDLWLGRRHDNEAELKLLIANKRDVKYVRYLDYLDRDISHTKRILDIIDAAIAVRASPGCVEWRLSQLKLATPGYLLSAMPVAFSESTETL